MKIINLFMHNFMPYKGNVEIPFPQDEKRNVLVVFADNTLGKTCMLNAIRWAFYDEVLDRHSRVIPLQKIVNWDAQLEDDWEVEVNVSFEANNIPYELRRVANRKKNVASPNKPSDFLQSVHLTRDGKVMPSHEVKAELEYLVPKQISRFFLFDGELLQEYETLLFEGDQQGKEIKKAIEQVLGVPALTNGREDIQTILRSARKQQTNDMKQIKGLEALAERQSQLNQLIESIDRDLIDLDEQLKEVSIERKNLSEQLDAGQSVLVASEKLKTKCAEESDINQEIQIKEDEKLDITSDAWKDLIHAQIQIIRSRLIQERDNLYSSIKQHSILQHTIKELSELLNTNQCPTCEQTIHEEHRKQIGGKLGEAETDLLEQKDIQSKYQKVLNQVEALSKIRSTNARDRLQQVMSDLRRNHVRLTRVENEIQELKDEIEDQDSAELERIRIHHERLIKQAGKLELDIQNRKDERAKYEEELAVSQRTISGSTETRLLRSEKKVNLCSDLEQVFSISIEELREKLREKVQEIADFAFKQMISKKSYRGLIINENYGLQILDDKNRYVTIRSAGAEQVVALSLIDGLNRVGRSKGPVIMDTPFGRLDENHRKNVLSYLPTVSGQLVLLVHSGELNKELDLEIIADRIFGIFEIVEVSSAQSRIERI